MYAHRLVINVTKVREVLDGSYRRIATELCPKRKLNVLQQTWPSMEVTASANVSKQDTSTTPTTTNVASVLPDAWSVGAIALVTFA